MTREAENRSGVRWVELGAAALLVVFALLQWNDPDPWIWIALYFLSAGLLAAAALGWSRRWATWLVLAVQLAAMLPVLPGFVDWLLNRPWGDLVGVMSTERQYIEDSRELLGLLISIALVIWFRLLRPGR